LGLQRRGGKGRAEEKGGEVKVRRNARENKGGS